LPGLAGVLRHKDAARLTAAIQFAALNASCFWSALSAVLKR